MATGSKGGGLHTVDGTSMNGAEVESVRSTPMTSTCTYLDLCSGEGVGVGEFRQKGRIFRSFSLSLFSLRLRDHGTVETEQVLEQQ